MKLLKFLFLTVFLANCPIFSKLDETEIQIAQLSTALFPTALFTADLIPASLQDFITQTNTDEGVRINFQVPVEELQNVGQDVIALQEVAADLWDQVEPAE